METPSAQPLEYKLSLFIGNLSLRAPEAHQDATKEHPARAGEIPIGIPGHIINSTAHTPNHILRAVRLSDLELLHVPCHDCAFCFPGRQAVIKRACESEDKKNVAE